MTQSAFIHGGAPRHGYDVDTVELMECNIDVFKANTRDGENITIQQGDAVNLKNIIVITI